MKILKKCKISNTRSKLRHNIKVKIGTLIMIVLYKLNLNSHLPDHL
jgi:hypothetical protein